MAPELDVLFSTDISIETVLMMHEQGIYCNVNDGQISEIIF